MNDNYKIREQLLSPPGDTIQETLDHIGMNQYELAERLGKNIKNVNQIIKGKEPITYDTAIALEQVLDIPADFWLERERNYRQELAEIAFEKELDQCKEWLKTFPIAAMKKLSWIPNDSDPILLMKSLLKFFGIASPEQWNTIYLKDQEAVAFRISLASISEPEAISAWLRKGELDAKALSLNDFDKTSFKTALQDIKLLSFHHPSDFKEKLQALCASAGVALVYTPSIPKAYISGATRWIFNNSTPLIQLSGRYKTNDHFWFTFFHEAAHILLHGKKDIFLEDVDGIKHNIEKEKEADTFASRSLFSDADYKSFIAIHNFSKESIVSFSKKIKTHPGIIVGRLQHVGYLSHSALNLLKEKIDLFS